MGFVADGWDSAQCGVGWRGSVRFGEVWCGLGVFCGLLRFGSDGAVGAVWFGCCGVVRFGAVRCGLVRFPPEGAGGVDGARCMKGRMILLARQVRMIGEVRFDTDWARFGGVWCVCCGWVRFGAVWGGWYGRFGWCGRLRIGAVRCGVEGAEGANEPEDSEGADGGECSGDVGCAVGSDGASRCGQGFGAVWCGLGASGAVRYGWCGWCGLVRFCAVGAVWRCSVRFGEVWSGPARCGMVRFGSAW